MWYRPIYLVGILNQSDLRILFSLLSSSSVSSKLPKWQRTSTPFGRAACTASTQKKFPIHEDSSKTHGEKKTWSKIFQNQKDVQKEQLQ